MRIEICWQGHSTSPKVYGNFRIDSERLQAVTGLEAGEFKMFINDGQPISGQGRIIYTLEHLDLGEGKYFLSVAICQHMLPKGKEAFLHYLEKASTFAVRRRVPWHMSFVYEPTITVAFESQ